MLTNKVSIQEVKEALKDPEFRNKLPPELDEDIRKYEQNPGCPCNLGIYRNVLSLASKELLQYYPGREVVNPETELPPLRQNNFTVINCSILELEGKLKELGLGDKQIAIARYEDQVTVIINDLSYDL